MIFNLQLFALLYKIKILQIYNEEFSYATKFLIIFIFFEIFFIYRVDFVGMKKTVPLFFYRDGRSETSVASEMKRK